MRSILRKVILASAFCAAVALAGNSAMAATRVNVPFDFSIAGKTLPAGGYDIVHDGSKAFITLRSLDARESYTWLLNPGPAESSTKIALRFDDRDGNHVLQSVQYGSMTTPRLDHTKSIDLERQTRGQ